MKFTFKTHKPTGRYRSFFKPDHSIKLNKCECGTIGHEPPHRIRLQIVKDHEHKDNNPNCPWMWITLSHQSKSVEDAKIFLNEHIDAIMGKYTIYRG